MLIFAWKIINVTDYIYSLLAMSFVIGIHSNNSGYNSMQTSPLKAPLKMVHRCARRQLLGLQANYSLRGCVGTGAAVVAVLALGHVLLARSPTPRQDRTSLAAAPACPPSTRPWLEALLVTPRTAAAASWQVAVDLDGPGAVLASASAPPPPPSRPLPRILLPPASVRACLSAWATAVTLHANQPWWAGRRLWGVGGAADVAGAAQMARPLCMPGSEAPPQAFRQDIQPQERAGNASPALFTACGYDDDACFFQAVLSLSQPVLWSGHAGRLSGWLGYDVQAAYGVIVVEEQDEEETGGAHGLAARTLIRRWLARPRRTLPCGALPTVTPIPTFQPATAARSLDTMLERHVLLTRHPDEDRLIEEAYAKRVGGDPAQLTDPAVSDKENSRLHHRWRATPHTGVSPVTIDRTRTPDTPHAPPSLSTSLQALVKRHTASLLS
jgi:hypothetical protein